MLKHVVLLFSLPLLLTSCILVPAIDSAQRAGLTESGRQRALETSLKDFHAALFWGRLNQAVAYAAPGSEVSLREYMRNNQGKGRMVDSRIEFIDYKDDSYQAHVEMDIKYHEFATNIVSPSKQYEQWSFSMSDGWKVVSLDASAAS